MVSIEPETKAFLTWRLTIKQCLGNQKQMSTVAVHKAELLTRYKEPIPRTGTTDLDNS
jgi:hypothetical protein